jgi:hypothetical protein
VLDEPAAGGAEVIKLEERAGIGTVKPAENIAGNIREGS